MATSSNQPNRASAHSSTPERPATIAELAASAQNEIWDPSKPLKHWLRIAEKARKAGQAYVEAQNYEAAFVEFARAATIVLEKLPTHNEYHILLNTEQRHNLGMNGQDMLDHLSQLKQILVDRYEKWRSKRESDRASSPQHPDTLSRQERRKLEEQLRAQELEEQRAREAREAARMEEEWKRKELARKEAEESERRAREEGAWTRQSREARSRESSEARRVTDAREAAEHERQVQATRLRRGEEARRPQSDEERETLRKRVEERTRHEQEGILRRQQEAELAARAARLEIASASPSSTVRKTEYDHNRHSPQPESASRNGHVTMPVPVVTPQPSRPASRSQNVLSNEPARQGPPMLPLESPSKLEDDTDAEDDRNGSSNRRPGVNEDTPSKSKSVIRISYPPPITTTSPAPPDLGLIQYPTLMSQHQLKQGYVPSLQSMFSHPTSDPPSNSSLLFDAKPPGSLYSGILPKPSTPASPVIPPPPPGMSVVDVKRYPAYESRYLSGYRSVPPAGTQAPPVPVKGHSRSPFHISRIEKVASKEPEVGELKSVRLPRECLQRFVSIARVNTTQNRETCGLLLGKDKGNKFVVTTLLIPKQHSTSDTCTMDEEELVMQFTEERHLITLGWIHTHPTQSCFMSSVDLHTHSGFQRMLPESFAVVCAPKSTPTFGIFRLTDPGGLQTILRCNAKEAFHPHADVPIYTDCDNSHVVMKDMSLEIVDLRF